MSKPLIVGVDIRDLKVAKTGTLTYLQELVREFEKMNSSKLRFHFIDTSLPVYTGNNKLLKWVEHFKYQLWKQVVLPLKAWGKNCDIVFCTDNFVPIIHLGYKTIPVFHDAFFFEMPESYGKLWLWIYKKTALPAARRSPVIITPTEHSKKQLQHFTGLAAQKFEVVFEGPRSLTNAKKENSLADLQLPIEPGQYILHVGSFFKRKNLPALILAFSKIKAAGYDNLKLVLAGPLPANAHDSDYQLVLDTINQTGQQNSVVMPGYLPDAALETLYKNALIYVFPSVNEGFGIPVLEAFSNSLPVLVANNTCLPEVGGDAVLTFDPFDIDDMRNKIMMALNDGRLREQLIAKGNDRLAQFSWHKTATRLIAVFESVAANGL